MRMIMIEEKKLDELVEGLKLKVSEKCLKTAKYANNTGTTTAVDEVERHFIYHFCGMVDKIKEG